MRLGTLRMNILKLCVATPQSLYQCESHQKCIYLYFIFTFLNRSNRFCIQISCSLCIFSGISFEVLHHIYFIKCRKADYDKKENIFHCQATKNSSDKCANALIAAASGAYDIEVMTRENTHTQWDMDAIGTQESTNRNSHYCTRKYVSSLNRIWLHTK